ncbi:MAG: hypothetical protein V4787_19600 [Pseudomonadota bacterium]
MSEVGESKGHKGGWVNPAIPKFEYKNIKEGEDRGPGPLEQENPPRRDNGNNTSAPTASPPPAPTSPPGRKHVTLPRPRSLESGAADIDITSLRRDLEQTFRQSQQDIRKMNLEQKAVYLAQAKEQIDKEYNLAIEAAGKALSAELAAAGGKIAGGIASLGGQAMGGFKLGKSGMHAKRAEAATEKAGEIKGAMKQDLITVDAHIKDLKGKIKIEEANFKTGKGRPNHLKNLKRELDTTVKLKNNKTANTDVRVAAQEKIATSSTHKTSHHEAMSKIYSGLGTAASSIIQGIGESISARFNYDAALKRAEGQRTHETKELLDGLMQQNDSFGEQAKRALDSIDSSQQQQAASTAQVLSSIAHNI